MVLREQIKNYATKIVERRPDPSQLLKMVRSRKPLTARFADDGVIPNNPRFPLILYRSVLSPVSDFATATVIDALFESNGWGRSWRDTIYDFVHYHSQIHEVLGVARGSAKIECGGIKGRVFTVSTGDVVILPAGTGHRLINATRDFLVVGAYPENGTYDECTDTRDRPDAVKRIRKVTTPRYDPVYGKKGPLLFLWKRVLSHSD